MKQIQAWATGEAGLQRWEAYEAAANLVLKRKCSEEAAEFLRQRFRYWMSQNTWQRYDCYMSALKDAGLD
jgi:predicted trehalose synthase